MAIKYRKRWKPGQTQYVIGQGQDAVIQLTGELVVYDRDTDMATVVAERTFQFSLVALATRTPKERSDVAEDALTLWAREAKREAEKVSDLIVTTSTGAGTDI